MGCSTQKSVKSVATLAALFIALATAANAQTCVTAEEMDAAIKSALTSTARRYYGWVGAEMGVTKTPFQVWREILAD